MNEIVKFEGIGIHTGNPCAVSIFHFRPNSGIQFIDSKTPDLLIPANLDCVISTDRNTSIGRDGIVIQTIEHLMAAMAAANINDVLVSVSGGEVPIMDGSAKFFTELFLKANSFQKEDHFSWNLIEKVSYSDVHTGAKYYAEPAGGFEIKCSIDYPNSIGKQSYFLKNLCDFEMEIAPSRTFCELDDILNLAQNNRIKGGDLSNSLILKTKTNNGELFKKMALKMSTNLETLHRLLHDNFDSIRFENEPVRHKILDIIGDFYLVGGKISGSFEIDKPGHASNIRFLKYLKQNELITLHQSLDLEKSSSLHS